MNTKYLYPISAIVCCLILGGSFIAVQINKQESIEYQKQLEIDQERDELEYQKQLKEEEDTQERLNKIFLDDCLESAEEVYWNYVKLNGTEVDGEAGTYRGSQYMWDEAQERREAEEDKCFKKY